MCPCDQKETKRDRETERKRERESPRPSQQDGHSQTSSEEHGEELLGGGGEGARGDLERPVGTVEHPDERDQRPHLQHSRVRRSDAHDLEAAERSRQELAPRVQVARAARLSDQERQREGRPAVQGAHRRHTDAQGLSVHRGAEGPGRQCAREGQTARELSARRRALEGRALQGAARTRTIRAERQRHQQRQQAHIRLVGAHQERQLCRSVWRWRWRRWRWCHGRWWWTAERRCVEQRSGGRDRGRATVGRQRRGSANQVGYHAQPTGARGRGAAQAGRRGQTPDRSREVQERGTAGSSRKLPSLPLNQLNTTYKEQTMFELIVVVQFKVDRSRRVRSVVEHDDADAQSNEARRTQRGRGVRHRAQVRHAFRLAAQAQPEHQQWRWPRWRRKRSESRNKTTHSHMTRSLYK